MYNTLQKYINSKTQLTDAGFELIISLSAEKKLRRNQYLLQEGDVCKFVAFVTSGCLRTYTVDEKNNEHIIYFAIENWWSGDRESFMDQQPSKFNIDAVEETEIIMFNKENFEQLCLAIPAFNTMINAILQKGFIASQNRITAAISYTAEERYQNFLEKYPAFANRIPQQMIASFLGITPETLSRVRKAIAKRHHL